jgi:hypothetical protein
MNLKKRILWTALLAAFALGTGACASVVKFELPERYKQKKLKEDPPVSFVHPVSAIQGA